MTLSPGDLLGHYAIEGPLGAGGMGEVYRATDTRLGRQVALKVLPDAVARDPERLARFEREARTLGSVSHPNIAVLYGLETDTDSGTSFLAMELVEGDDLAQRISQGPLSIENTVELGRQIASGLEAAHSKGIVHRDLKPSNIRITPEGTVKILDFGLAKEQGPEPGSVEFNESPTITAEMTRAGTILGTAPYLSPEQARGQAVDRRTDIWALGCVLYEMLTARRAFPGKTSTEILAQVLERDPDWSALSASVSPALRRILERCIEKEPNHRLRDAGDVALALEDLDLGSPANTAYSSPHPVARLAPWLVAAAAAIVAVVAWVGRPPPAPQIIEGEVLRFSEATSAPLDIARIGHMGSAVAISPDGQVLVWVGVNGAATQLFSRHLDELEARPIDGTEGGLAPFFSPDGEWIGFWADEKLKKIAVRGGAPQTICAADHVHGASWGDGVILAELGGAGYLVTIDLASGEIQETTLSSESNSKTNFLASFPKLLPGSKSALISGLDGQHVGLLSLETGEITPLLVEGSNASYVSTGHLLWIWEDNLLAAPFDLGSLTLSGDAYTVVEGVLSETGFASHYAVSDEGTLVYLPGTAAVGALQPSWLRLDGETEPLQIPPGHTILSPRVSPDGRKVLFSRAAETREMLVADLERGTISPLTPEKGNYYWAVWTPDSNAVIFNWFEGQVLDLWMGPADFSKPPRRLTTTPGQLHVPMEITHDGRTVLLGATPSLNDIIDLHVLDLDGDGATRPLLELDANVIQPKLSPDGRLLAYASDRSDRFEIYLQSFPRPGATIRVSPNGGQEPLWSPSGDRIYYRSVNGKQIFAVNILDSDPLRLGPEQLLVEGDFAPGIRFGRKWDIHPDGERFLVLKIETSETPKVIRVVRNWFNELEQLVPTGKETL